MPREEAAEIEQTVSRCPRAVRTATATGPGPGSKPGTPDLSWGSPAGRGSCGPPETGTSGQRARWLRQGRAAALAVWGRGLSVRQS